MDVLLDDEIARGWQSWQDARARTALDTPAGISSQ